MYLHFMLEPYQFADRSKRRELSIDLQIPMRFLGFRVLDRPSQQERMHADFFGLTSRMQEIREQELVRDKIVQVAQEQLRDFLLREFQRMDTIDGYKPKPRC